jgi:uncharacterized RDD family membrane protein YckC
MSEPIPQQSYASAGSASGPRAGFWRRFAAAFVDGIVGFGIPYGVLYALLSPGAAYGLALLISIVYFSYFEGSASGQGVGKKLLGIRVIDYNTGGPIGFGRGFLRWIGRLLSSLLLYLGYLWMLWDKEKQTWHDKIANCVVVPAEDYPVSSWPN